MYYIICEMIFIVIPVLFTVIIYLLSKIGVLNCTIKCKNDIIEILNESNSAICDLIDDTMETKVKS